MFLLANGGRCQFCAHVASDFVIVHREDMSVEWVLLDCEVFGEKMVAQVECLAFMAAGYSM